MKDGTDAGAQLALAGEELIGSPFRLYGRNPETGLDCVGLVTASLSKIGRIAQAPKGYALRNVGVGQWLSLVAANGFEPCIDETRRGDLIMTRPGPGQFHLLIATGPRHVIHAHAGLGRVVRQPLDIPALVEARWRLTAHE